MSLDGSACGPEAALWDPVSSYPGRTVGFRVDRWVAEREGPRSKPGAVVIQ